MEFNVTFKEKGKAPQERWCDVPSEQDVIQIYGLDEEDIEYYSIKKHNGTKDGYNTEVEVFSTKEKALDRMQEISESYLNDFEVTEDSDECEIEKQEDSISVYPKGYYGDYSVELWIKEDKVK